MAILCIDTCFPACIAGVVRLGPSGLGAGEEREGPSAFAEGLGRIIPMARGQAERLIPLVQDVMAAAAVTIDQIDLIVVNVGPGSFTGVRVGLAAAQGLALPRGIAVQGVSSIDILAHLARAGGVVAPAVRIDTGRRDYFAVDFTPDQAWCDIDAIAIETARADDAVTEALALAANPEAYVLMMAAMGAELTACPDHPLSGRAAPIYVREAETTTPKRA
jgi:tRNA threonylcarbamoyladenosine biosynthesis protein TsaB